MTTDTEQEAGQVNEDIAHLAYGLLEAVMNELTMAGDDFGKLGEKEQNEVIERMRGRVRTLIEQTVALLMRGKYPVLTAQLGKVAFGKEITATLIVPKGSKGRHRFADSTGQNVLVVIADANNYLQRLEDIKARSGQADMLKDDGRVDIGELLGTLAQAGFTVSHEVAEDWTPLQQKVALQYAKRVEQPNLPPMIMPGFLVAYMLRGGKKP